MDAPRLSLDETDMDAPRLSERWLMLVLAPLLPCEFEFELLTLPLVVVWVCVWVWQEEAELALGQSGSEVNAKFPGNWILKLTLSSSLTTRFFTWW